MFMWKRASPVKRPDLKADESFKLFVSAARSVPKDDAVSGDSPAARPTRTYVRRDDPNVIDIEVVEKPSSVAPDATAQPPAPEQASASRGAAPQPVADAVPMPAAQPEATPVHGAGLTARRVRPAAPPPQEPSAGVSPTPAAPEPAARGGWLSGMLGRKKTQSPDPELAQVLEAMKALSEEAAPQPPAPAEAEAAVPSQTPSKAPASSWAARFRNTAGASAPAAPESGQTPAADTSAAPEPATEPARSRFSMPNFKRKVTPAATETVAAAASTDAAQQAPVPETAAPESASARTPRAGLNAFMGPRAGRGSASSTGAAAEPPASGPTASTNKPSVSWFSRLGGKRNPKEARSAPSQTTAATRETGSEEKASRGLRTGWLPVLGLGVLAAGAAGFAFQQYQAVQQADAERSRLTAAATQADNDTKAFVVSAVTSYAKTQALDLGLASERAALMWAPRREVTLQLEASRQQFDVRLAPGTAARLAADSPELAALLSEHARALRELPTPPGCTRTESQSTGDPYAVQVRFVCEAADAAGRGAGRG